jgi:hypothetical protein
VNGTLRAILAGAIALFAVVACTPDSAVIPSLPPDVHVECGPIGDRALCVKAAELAATVKVNAPPIVDVRVRSAGPSDPCVEWLPPCGPDAVIVQIQSGDTVQSIPLVPSAGTWALLGNSRDGQQR